MAGPAESWARRRQSRRWTAGVLVAGSCMDLGRTLTRALSARGTANPDISTPDSFKQTLLKARSGRLHRPQSGGASPHLPRRPARTHGRGGRQKGAVCATATRRSTRFRRAMRMGPTFLSEIVPMKAVKAMGPLPARLEAPTCGRDHDGGAATARRPGRFIAMLTAPAQREAWLWLDRPQTRDLPQPPDQPQEDRTRGGQASDGAHKQDRAAAAHRNNKRWQRETSR